MSVQGVEVQTRKPLAVTSGHWGCCPRCYNLVHDREADGTLLWHCIWCGVPLNWDAAFEEKKAAHAHWKFIIGDEYTEDYKCSNCGCEITIYIELNREEKPRYCKDCGAKMGG